MAHFKRRKSRRRVRCTLCTPHRWRGNGKGRHKERFEARVAAADGEAYNSSR
jgi:hypothetical protein